MKLWIMLNHVKLSWTYLLKGAPRTTKILILSVSNKILKIWDTLFEILQIEVQCIKNYFNIFLSQEVGASGNNIEKEPQKPRPRLKKYILSIYREYLLCLQFNASGSFLQTYILILQNSDSNFLTLKVP